MSRFKEFLMDKRVMMGALALNIAMACFGIVHGDGDIVLLAAVSAACLSIGLVRIDERER
tara:strand:+ start:13088 stop:13267 length:180 start_codon:yes stop_codon:yes gene_type:complete